MFKRRHTGPAVDSPTRSTNEESGEDPSDPFRSGRTILGRWIIERTIGKGSYGRVKVARDLQMEGQRVALKFISRANIRKPQHTVRIQREIALMRAMNHEHIARLYERIDTETDIILVMEYVSGGDLYDRISAAPSYRLSEKEARPLFRQVVSALDYCHHHRIIHRDIKPENVMLAGPKERSTPVDRLSVKLIDFGFANLYDPQGCLQTNCGSPLYAAPEIIQGVQYVGPEVDIWSLGVTLYAMLTGMLPFEDEQLKGLYAKICAGKFTFPSHVSSQARDLISMMLRTDVGQRAGMQAVRMHRWTCAEVDEPPMNFFPSQYSLLHVDTAIVEQLVSEYGFSDRETTVRNIKERFDSPAHAIYMLLLQRQAPRTSISAASMGRPMSVDGGLMSPPLSPVKAAEKPATNNISRLAASVASHFRRLRE